MNWTEGWHFCPADARLGYEDGRLIVVGETLTVEGSPVLCDWGLHASREAWDALSYATDQSRLCRVRLGGEIIYNIDKAVATERTCLAMLSEHETAVLLRRWAVWCVRRVEHLLTDERSRRALDVAEAWCASMATDEDLANAEEAAWEAARPAYATWAAARAARAAYATWAVRDAARDAAWSAAGAAAWVAAGAAARDAARDAQRQQLETMCLEAINTTSTREGG